VHRRVPVAIVLVLTVALLGACSTAPQSAVNVPASTRDNVPSTQSVPTSTAKRLSTLTAHHFGGTPAVGALFPPRSSVHICTASVVDSATGNLLITAAHCISGTGRGYVFAPGYHDGIEPFGSWTVVAAYGSPEWISLQAPQSDFAFLVVAPREVNGHPEQIEDVTGGNRLGSAPASGGLVTVPAYAAGRGGDPITCTAPVYYDATYPAFNCGLYVGGTSGSPWLQHSSHGWVVVGVIGGLHQGGCYPEISYSAAFGVAMLHTDALAAAGLKTSTFPAAGSDGCNTS